jgi:hypothetical protein
MTSRKLVIGTKPLPIGGVTIHVERLLQLLSKNKVEFEFIDLKRVPKLNIVKAIFLAKRIHLHTSNVYLRFFLSLFGKLAFKEIDFTLHGNLGRYKSRVKNYLDLLTIRLATIPVVLNEHSFKIAIKLNRNTVLGSAFIPPDLDKEIIEETLKQRIIKLKIKVDYLFSTNASNLSFDKTGQEIYGIFDLINLFSNLPQYGLIISDPSAAYEAALKEKKTSIPENILLLSEPHSFYKVIELSNATIRNTSTDGDSISVRESLYIQKPTFCTDVVSRPQGALTYRKGELKTALNKIDLQHDNYSGDFKKETDHSLNKLLELYKK